MRCVASEKSMNDTAYDDDVGVQKMNVKLELTNYLQSFLIMVLRQIVPLIIGLTSVLLLLSLVDIFKQHNVSETFFSHKTHSLNLFSGPELG